MNLKIQTSFLFVILLLTSCGQIDVQKTQENAVVITLSEAERAEKLVLGDSISNIAQATLLQNVSNAIKAGGSAYAIEFCNIQAVPLMDSVSKVHKVKIERITDKHRNPVNYLKTDADKSAWFKFKEAFFKLEKSTPFLYEEESQTLIYYKPIAIGLQSCLKCHGAPEKDIDAKTAAKINEIYPKDLATNYKMGDFRGMWKVTFKR